jgi:hypothetical protein
MKPFLNMKNLSFHDLPPLLAYHLSFFDTLAACTVGRINVTTVEAKVQSVINYEDIMGSVLDAGTLLIAKVHMCWFFYHAIVDVEMVIPGLETSVCLWKYLDAMPVVFEETKTELDLLAVKLGWESDLVWHPFLVLVCFY